MKYMAHSCCSVCMKHSLYKSIRWLLFNDGASEDHWCFSTVSLEGHYCRNCRRRETKQSACWGSVMMGGSALGVMEAMFWSYTLLLLLLCVCVCLKPLTGDVCAFKTRVCAEQAVFSTSVQVGGKNECLWGNSSRRTMSNMCGHLNSHPKQPHWNQSLTPSSAVKIYSRKRLIFSQLLLCFNNTLVAAEGLGLEIWTSTVICGLSLCCTLRPSSPPLPHPLKTEDFLSLPGSRSHRGTSVGLVSLMEFCPVRFSHSAVGLFSPLL